MDWSPRSAVSNSSTPRWGNWPAHPALRRIVSTYWWVRGQPSVTHIKVLPDASADLTFDLSRRAAPRAYVAPSLVRPTSYPLPRRTWLFGARIFPDAASLLIGRSLASLPPGWTPLERFLGAAATTLAQQVATAKDDAARTALLDGFFVDRVLTRSADARLSAALSALFANGGTLSMKQLAKVSASSERTLGRLFDRWVGVAPKRFARIVRFQLALRRLDGTQSWAQLATELGYFDQAHLIREMRELFGGVPTEARAMLGVMA
jgi:AraC-like DNA-binding protein